MLPGIILIQTYKSVCVRVCVYKRERERERSPEPVRALSVDGEDKHLFGVVERSQKVP